MSIDNIRQQYINIMRKNVFEYDGDIRSMNKDNTIDAYFLSVLKQYKYLTIYDWMDRYINNNSYKEKFNLLKYMNGDEFLKKEYRYMVVAIELYKNGKYRSDDKDVDRHLKYLERNRDKLYNNVDIKEIYDVSGEDREFN